MMLGGHQNTIKSHLVFTALFCFAPFSVFSSCMSAPYYWSVGPRSACQYTMQHFELNVALQSLVCRSPVPMARHITAF
jgi:hypothetical protein